MSFLSAVFGKPATADPDPHPGIGGYDTPRGPAGQTGLPGSTAATRQNPQAGEDRIHDAPLRPAPVGGRRFTSRATPTITAQQARGIPPPAENGSLPFRGPDAKTNPWFQDYPLNNVADTEVRPHIVISEGIPGGERQRNTVYYGGRQAIPGAEHSYKPATRLGRFTDMAPVEVPSRYVYGGINGGTDALDDIMTSRRMPYTGHGEYRGQLGHARGSLRGASLDGNRFYQAPDTELNQGGAYGQRIRGSQRHRPTIFNEPAPMNSQNYDTTANAGGPDVPGTNTQIAQNIHVSPSATRKGWRRG
jgi:hypothetical protein